MIKKYYDYILLLFVFLLFIFSSNINRFLTAINPNLDNSKIVVDYNKYLKDELDSIRKINDINDYDNLDLIVSRVKYRNVYEYSDTLTIFKGFKNNVFKGDIVLNNDGLIGFISKISDKYSEIKYIYNSRVPVKINNEYGKIIGSDIDNNLIVSEVENVNINDKVYSVNNSYIGKVIKIDNNNLNKKLTIKTIDLSNINYVLIRSI